MRAEVTLHPTRCAICRTPGNATQAYPERLPPGAFSTGTFSARRVPDQVHCRMVRCDTCGLVRADPAAGAGLLSQLYRGSTFDYGAELSGLRRTYGDCLRRAAGHRLGRGPLLEIGCGNGFLLEEALVQGFHPVAGVEPSAGAIECASPSVRGSIVCDVMRPGLFDARQFAVVALFQVLDHLPDPAQTVAECCRVLERGGTLLCVVHNVGALSARVLGRRSPIIDVEHTYLFSASTLSRLCETAGLEVRTVFPVWNSYSLRYLMHLAPLPSPLKRAALRRPLAGILSRICLRAPLGNLCLIAQKP